MFMCWCIGYGSQGRWACSAAEEQRAEGDQWHPGQLHPWLEVQPLGAQGEAPILSIFLAGFGSPWSSSSLAACVVLCGPLCHWQLFVICGPLCHWQLLACSGPLRYWLLLRMCDPLHHWQLLTFCTLFRHWELLALNGAASYWPEHTDDVQRCTSTSSRTVRESTGYPQYTSSLGLCASNAERHTLFLPFLSFAIWNPET